MNDEYSKNVAKHLKKQNMGELAPGATARRYEPKEGLSNLNKRIHRESTYTDKYKDMPFSFSKPKKAKKSVVKICANCKEPVSVNKDTVGVICRSCKIFSKVEEVCIEEK